MKDAALLTAPDDQPGDPAVSGTFDARIAQYRYGADALVRRRRH
jgi:hypothetical protein